MVDPWETQNVYQSGPSQHPNKAAMKLTQKAVQGHHCGKRWWQLLSIHPTV